MRIVRFSKSSLTRVVMRVSALGTVLLGFFTVFFVTSPTSDRGVGVVNADAPSYGQSTYYGQGGYYSQSTYGDSSACSACSDSNGGDSCDSSCDGGGGCDAP